MAVLKRSNSKTWCWQKTKTANQWYQQKFPLNRKFNPKQSSRRPPWSLCPRKFSTTGWNRKLDPQSTKIVQKSICQKITSPTGCYRGKGTFWWTFTRMSWSTRRLKTKRNLQLRLKLFFLFYNFQKKWLLKCSVYALQFKTFKVE